LALGMADILNGPPMPSMGQRGWTGTPSAVTDPPRKPFREALPGNGTVSQFVPGIQTFWHRCIMPRTLNF